MMPVFINIILKLIKIITKNKKGVYRESQSRNNKKLRAENSNTDNTIKQRNNTTPTQHQQQQHNFCAVLIM